MNRCDDCAYFVYDEYTEQYVCTMDLDEDEMLKFISCRTDNCPYYRNGDEYSVVRKQN